MTQGLHNRGHVLADPCFLHWYTPSLFVLDIGASIASRSMGSNWSYLNKRLSNGIIGQGSNTPKNESFSSRPSYWQVSHYIAVRSGHFQAFREEVEYSPPP